MEQPKKARGLASASVSAETKARVTKLGGDTISQNRPHMIEIGKKGGTLISQNREHMREIGRKGGQATAAKRQK